MNILIFSHEFPPISGGAGTFSYELATALSELGYTIHVLCGHSQSLAEDQKIDMILQFQKVKVTRLDWVFQNKLWFLFDKVRVQRFLARHECFDHILFANFSAVSTGCKLNLPSALSYSVYLHGTEVNYFKSSLHLRSLVRSNFLFPRTRAALFFARAKYVFCGSKSAYQKFVTGIPFEMQLRVLPLGITLPVLKEYYTNNLFKKELSEEKFNVIGVSRLEFGKGIDELITVFQSDNFLRENCNLIIIGGGSLLSSFQNDISDNSHIKLTGKLSREDVFTLLKYADAYVHMSEYETFGLSVLEAMAVGLPVFVRPRGGLIEIITHGVDGILSEPNELSGHIASVLIDPEYTKKLSNASRLTVECHYSARKMAKNFLNYILAGE
jgi:glycosyltransferase involved in cell wall biosynthesis